MHSRLLRSLASTALWGAFVLFATTARAQQDPEATASADGSSGIMSRVLDDLPVYLVERLPMLDPNGAVQISVRPHLGDFFHQDDVRVPVLVRWQVAPHVELNDEIESYYAHTDGSRTVGLAGTAFGVKWEPVRPTLEHAGLAFGVDYRTPFSHSPMLFTDGYRHLQPYVASTRILVPEWRLLGYTNLGANFLEHTNLPSNFGRNQLHSDSVALAVGVAREWKYFRASLTARLASTALMSDEHRQNFQLRPEIAFPLRRNPDARTQINLTLGGRVMWGPDGRQINTNGGVRVDFHLDRARREQQPVEETSHLFPM